MQLLSAHCSSFGFLHSTSFQTAARSAVPSLKTRPLADLHQELRACQQRLGTSDERAGDFEHARDLAHEINNRRQVEYLRSVVSVMAA